VHSLPIYDIRRLKKIGFNTNDGFGTSLSFAAAHLTDSSQTGSRPRADITRQVLLTHFGHAMTPPDARHCGL
jgi:hypothetical protein